MEFSQKDDSADTRKEHEFKNYLRYRTEIAFCNDTSEERIGQPLSVSSEANLACQPRG